MMALVDDIVTGVAIIVGVIVAVIAIVRPLRP